MDSPLTDSLRDDTDIIIAITGDSVLPQLTSRLESSLKNPLVPQAQSPVNFAPKVLVRVHQMVNLKTTVHGGTTGRASCSSFGFGFWHFGLRFGFGLCLFFGFT